MSKPRVLVVGWDGATPELLVPWASEGRLPFIRKLIGSGSSGRLKSTIQPLSPQAWCTFMTGKNPGKHGIFDFTERVPGTYQVRLVNASCRLGRSLWRILSDRGHKVCVINVPITYPPEPVNGFLISGMDTPSTSARFTHPPELAEELKKRFGEYLLGRNMWEFILKDRQAECVAAFRAMSEQTAAVARYLLEKGEWDLFVVVFRATDESQHLFWHCMAPDHPYAPTCDPTLGPVIPDVYKLLDSLTSTLFDAAKPSQFLLLSDHGAAPYGDKSLYLNTWLEERGYLRFKTRPAARTGIGRSRIFWNLKHLAARALPVTVKEELRRVLPGLFDKLKSASYFSHIDWESTRVFSEEVQLNLWVNLRGREPSGTVAPEDFEPLRDRVIAELYELRDPESGRRLIEDAYRSEELYWGAAFSKAPDVVALLASGGAPVPRSSVLAESRAPLRRVSPAEARLDLKPVAGHSLYGWLGMMGDGVLPANELRYAHIADLAPTILHLLDEPIPADMDGTVLVQALSTGRPIRYEAPSDEPPDGQHGQPYSPSESRQVAERLRGLGYIE